MTDEIETVPDARSLPALHLSDDWEGIEIERPRETIGALRERLRREMANHQRLVERLAKEAADASEQADSHRALAAECWEVLEALNRAQTEAVE